MLQIFYSIQKCDYGFLEKSFCHIYRTIEVRLEAPETAVVILNTQATGPFHNIYRIFYLTYFYIFLRVPCHFLYCRRLLSSQL